MREIEGALDLFPFLIFLTFLTYNIKVFLLLPPLSAWNDIKRVVTDRASQWLLTNLTCLK